MQVSFKFVNIGYWEFTSQNYDSDSFLHILLRHEIIFFAYLQF
jgi:hypothetical protein